jgi:hypothetical protein
MYLILPALGLEVYSAPNKNEYQKKKMFLESTARPALNRDSLSAICEATV